MRRSIVARGHSYATNARSPWADLPSTRFLNEIGNGPSTRGEFAEQIAVQIRHLRAHEDSVPALVAPDPAVSNDGDDLPRLGIENDVLGKDEILSYGFCLEY